MSTISFPVKTGPSWRHGQNIVFKRQPGAEVYVMPSLRHAWRHLFCMVLILIDLDLGDLATSSRLCHALYSLCRLGNPGACQIRYSKVIEKKSNFFFFASISK